LWHGWGERRARGAHDAGSCVDISRIERRERRGGVFARDGGARDASRERRDEGDARRERGDGCGDERVSSAYEGHYLAHTSSRDVYVRGERYVAVW
jgi:hypothetical protein